MDIEPPDTDQALIPAVDLSDSTVKIALSHFIAAGIQSMGLTKEQFAHRAGMCTRTASRYLPGKQFDPPNTVPADTYYSILGTLKLDNKEFKTFLESYLKEESKKITQAPEKNMQNTIHGDNGKITIIEGDSNTISF